jgi:bifunctional DNA-binding transcriptional regulator/antitoxin component of YhaV-PrlF toxin-antitoxin module
MRVTIKGQVTIPQEIREKMGITPHSAPQTFRRVRGLATVKMSTDEIMALTRGGA